MEANKSQELQLASGEPMVKFHSKGQKQVRKNSSPSPRQLGRSSSLIFLEASPFLLYSDLHLTG